MAFSCQEKNLVQTTDLTPAFSIADTVTTIPRLTVLHKKEAETEPVLRSLSVQVETWGNASVTTMDMVFYNPNNRVLEAEMVFPLGENQSISRLAVEKNGTLQEGVVVEKNKGQEVFESIERRNVDPVLVEHVAGNNYRARIYPVPPMGSKRIVIAFEQELDFHENYLLYHLPLEYGLVLDQFNLKTIVHNNRPDSISLNRPHLYKDFYAEGSDWISTVSKTSEMLNHHVAFTIPLDDKKEWTVSQFDHNENKTYFFTSLILPPSERPKSRPEKIAVYWDVSGSCDSLSQAQSRAMLRAYLLHYKPSVVDVIPFSYGVHDTKSFVAADGNVQPILQYLEWQSFDGGTQLGVVRNDGGYNEVFVFSDGMTNYGKDLPELMDIPVHCISASASTDMGLLRSISEKTGGLAINLMQTSIEEAFHKLTTQPLKLISATVPDGKGGRTNQGIYSGSTTRAGNCLSIAGYTEAAGDLELLVGFDRASAYSIHVNIAPNSNGILAKRMWARKKMESLALRADQNKEEMLATAKIFQLVTPLTSLIFLDTITDYIEYEIEPPGAMKEAYFKAMAEKNKKLEANNQKHIDEVATWFAERETWWNKDFTSAHKPAESKRKSRRNNANLEQIQFTEIEVNEEPATYMFDTDQSVVVSGFSNGAGGAVYTVGISDHCMATESREEEFANSIKSIELSSWNPDTPYLNKLKNTAHDQLYSVYLSLRKEYAATPSFFVDVADYLAQAGQTDNAVRVLSNLAEVDIKNYRLMRILAHRLNQMNKTYDAVDMFAKVLELHKEEPQSYRDLALALASNNQHQQAIETMYELITKNWDSRFPQIELIAAGEMNEIIFSSEVPLNTSFIDQRLLKHMPMDARVVLNWDADNCDIDLWVTDPRGEKCFYDHRDTKIGGHNSLDLTGGYGPEEFIIHKAMKGKYKIEINYYGDRQQSITGPTTIQVEVYTDYGKKSQVSNKITRRLTDKKETLEVGAFEVK